MSRIARYLYTASKLLTGGALSFSSPTFKQPMKIDLITLVGSSALTDTVTVTIVSVAGSTYDCVIDTSSLSAANNYVFKPAGTEYVLSTGDTVKVQCTNNTTATVYSTIKLSEA